MTRKKTIVVIPSGDEEFRKCSVCSIFRLRSRWHFQIWNYFFTKPSGL